MAVLFLGMAWMPPLIFWVLDKVWEVITNNKPPEPQALAPPAPEIQPAILLPSNGKRG